MKGTFGRFERRVEVMPDIYKLVVLFFLKNITPNVICDVVFGYGVVRNVVSMAATAYLCHMAIGVQGSRSSLIKKK